MIVSNRSVKPYFIIALAVFFILPQPIHAVWIEDLGTVELLSNVPVFVLYDPPGTKSYSRYTITAEVVFDIALDTQASGSGFDMVDTLVFSSTRDLSTHKDQYMHGVVAVMCIVKYHAYYYIYPTRSFYKLVPLEIKSVDTNSMNLYDFDELSNYGLFIKKDMTGEIGDYEAFRHLDSGDKINAESFYYGISDFYDLEVGYKTQYRNQEFKYSVSFRFEFSTNLAVEYFYQTDDGNTIDFYRCSKAPISSIPKDPHLNATSPLIWFRIIQ